MKKGRIYIGTSGWHYKHWVGNFYPENIKEKDQLNYYQGHFGSVEINNSFYHLPLLKTVTSWKNATPRGFRFAMKASRYITHMKKLKPDAASLRKFFTRADRLGEKLGPVLFQLPPKWKVNEARLQHLSPLEVTTGFVYIRLHGPGEKYQGNYSATTLKRWAERCLNWQAEGKDVYIYFDNDQHAYAAKNALAMKKYCGQDV